MSKFSMIHTYSNTIHYLFGIQIELGVLSFYLPSLATLEIVKKSRVDAATTKNNLAYEGHITLTPGFLSGLMPPALRVPVQQHHTH